MSKSHDITELLYTELRPKECIRARVKLIGRAAIIETEHGAKALVNIKNLCLYAKRLNLCLENYECPETLAT